MGCDFDIPDALTLAVLVDTLKENEMSANSGDPESDSQEYTVAVENYPYPLEYYPYHPSHFFFMESLNQRYQQSSLHSPLKGHDWRPNPDDLYSSQQLPGSSPLEKEKFESDQEHDVQDGHNDGLVDDLSASGASDGDHNDDSKNDLSGVAMSRGDRGDGKADHKDSPQDELSGSGMSGGDRHDGKDDHNSGPKDESFRGSLNDNDRNHDAKDRDQDHSFDNGTSGDDYIDVREGAYCYGGQGADHYVFREEGRLRVEDFNSQEGDKLDFDTGLGLTSKEHLAGFITEIHIEADNFIINFGDHVSITLVGVKPDQISWDDVSVMS